jgi:hypothetical protein
MARRIVVAAVWIWGFWALGSTVEFLGIAPSWPILIVGIAGAFAASGGLGRVVPQRAARLGTSERSDRETARI